jgi:hypothetical protein
MMNLTQMQRHIEALNHTIANQRELFGTLKYKEYKRRKYIHITWAIVWLLLLAVKISLVAPTVVADCSVDKQRTANAMAVLKTVSDERDNYAQSTEWFIEHASTEGE